MTEEGPLGGLAARVVAVHEMLDSLGVPHQFGGAIALAWYRNPRATTDIDLNVTVAPRDADPVLGALAHLGVVLGEADRRRLRRDGEARLRWDPSYLDLFLATLDFHHALARRARVVPFGPTEIPIMAPEHLAVCKAIFDRPKDWVDIEAMVAWGTKLGRGEALRWLAEILGEEAEQYQRLATVLAAARKSGGGTG